MKKFLAVLGVVFLIAIAFGIGGFIGSQQDGQNPFASFLNTSVNAAIDSSGVKDKIENALYDNVDAISKKTGLPKSTVEKAIDDLDRGTWKATTLPAGAKATGTSTINYNGAPAKITTYDDPSVVTIDSNGVSLTFEIPPSAQGDLSYLSYL